jgi:prophage regulatory protein
MPEFPRLAGLAEVAGLAGVSRKRAWQLTQHPNFPAPVQVLAMGPVWIEADVVKFTSTPRKPGRRVPDPRGASVPLRRPHRLRAAQEQRASREQ